MMVEAVGNTLAVGEWASERPVVEERRVQGAGRGWVVYIQLSLIGAAPGRTTLLRR